MAHDAKHAGKNISPIIAGVALGTAAVVAGVALSKKKNRDKLTKAAKGAFEKGKEFTSAAAERYREVEQRMIAAKGGKAATHTRKKNHSSKTTKKD